MVAAVAVEVEVGAAVVDVESAVESAVVPVPTLASVPLFPTG